MHEGMTKGKQVASQLARLEKAIDELHSMIGRVEESLSLILSNEALDKNLDEPQEDLVPLANEIRTRAQRVEAACDKLKRIDARIEL